MPEQDPLHEVTVVRDAFEYTPVVELPPWWVPGERVTARRGERITVDADDYLRGRKFAAFEDEPPLPTREVTVMHGLFEYTPQPFSSREPEWWRRTALCGETIKVLEEDFERGSREGAFSKWVPESAYGTIGDPPLKGTVVEWVNWVRASEPVAVERLLDELGQVAGSDPERLSAVRAICALLTGRDPHLPPHLNRCHDLIQVVVAPTPDDKAALREKVLDKLITNPDAVALILSDG